MPAAEPLIVGIDETLERRRGKKIAAKGVYRDPVRSTHENFVDSSGLRWICVMLSVEIPWGFSGLGFALPLGSGSFRALCCQAGQTTQEDNRGAWQLLLLVRRWYPQWEIVTIADRAYAALKLLERCRKLSNTIAFIIIDARRLRV